VPACYFLLLWLLATQAGLQEAVSLARQGRYSQARQALVGVAEPQDISQKIAFHRLKAAIASGLKENSVAANEMRAALAFAPANPQLLVATAVAEAEAQQFSQAIEHARSAPNNAAAQALIGGIEQKQGKFPEAVTAYREAIRLAPTSEPYRIALAATLIEHQAFESAIALLKDSPKSAKLRVLLGLAQYGHGDNAEAQESLEEAIALVNGFLGELTR